jgi:hypothetical protein
MGIRSHIRDVMKWAPMKPPYRAEVFNPETQNFYISGAACNVSVGIFSDQASADRMAALCNKIAEHYSA